MPRPQGRGKPAPAAAATPPAAPPERPAVPPIFKARDGQLKLSVWENEGQYGKMYACKICKVYKQGDEWKETSSIDHQDWPALARLLLDAYAEVLAEKGQGIQWPDAADGSGDGGVPD